MLPPHHASDRRRSDWPTRVERIQGGNDAILLEFPASPEVHHRCASFCVTGNAYLRCRQRASSFDR